MDYLISQHLQVCCVNLSAFTSILYNEDFQWWGLFCLVGDISGGASQKRGLEMI